MPAFLIARSKAILISKVHIFWEGHKFCKISTVDLSYLVKFKYFVAFSEYMNFNGQIYGGDFAKFCGLLKIYDL